MKRQALFLGLILCLLAPAAQADSAYRTNFVQQGCTNYGNQVLIGSSASCDEGTDCTNYGNQVVVGSNYECVGGNCPNDGVRISIGSSFCDHGGTYACVDDYCTDGRPPGSMQGSLPAHPQIEAHASSMAFADCIPKGQVGPAFTLKFTCDPSGDPCGINGQPVCWTFRFVCWNGLIVVLRVWDNIMPGMPPPGRPSSCEGQPGSS